MSERAFGILVALAVWSTANWVIAMGRLRCRDHEIAALRVQVRALENRILMLLKANNGKKVDA